MPERIDVVAALIIRDGRFFAAQRGPEQSHAGAWEFPGGKLEPGENHEEALARELFEELLIRVHVAEYLETGITEDAQRSIHVHLYRVLLETDDFRLSEHTQYGWFLPSELDGLRWTGADQGFLPRVAHELAHNAHVLSALPQELDALPVKASGGRIFRQVQRPWLYGELEHGDVNRLRPDLGASCLRVLETRYDMSLVDIDQTITCEDETTRIIYRLSDGAYIECIHMPRDVKSPRVSLCLSSQVGCAMACAFCATGSLGLKRNLKAAEIVQQVFLAMRLLGPARGHALTLVFMGMGEALMNTDEILKAIEILADESGLNIAPARMTLSTSGVLSSFEQLKNAKYRPNLAISLNATTDALRSQIMPINRRFPLAEIQQALLDWPYRTHEKILIEYVLLAGVNDSLEDAQRLAEFARPLPHNINIIPYNATPGTPFEAPSPAHCQDFIKAIQDLGCFVTLRQARGLSVGGACGQLVGKLIAHKKSGPQGRLD